jgi:hypothetical protein
MVEHGTQSKMTDPGDEVNYELKNIPLASVEWKS